VVTEQNVFKYYTVAIAMEQEDPKSFEEFEKEYHLLVDLQLHGNCSPEVNQRIKELSDILEQHPISREQNERAKKIADYEAARTREAQEIGNSVDALYNAVMDPVRRLEAEEIERMINDLHEKVNAHCTHKPYQAPK